MGRRGRKTGKASKRGGRGKKKGSASSRNDSPSQSPQRVGGKGKTGKGKGKGGKSAKGKYPPSKRPTKGTSGTSQAEAPAQSSAADEQTDEEAIKLTLQEVKFDVDPEQQVRSEHDKLRPYPLPTHTIQRILAMAAGSGATNPTPAGSPAWLKGAAACIDSLTPEEVVQLGQELLHFALDCKGRARRLEPELNKLYIADVDGPDLDTELFHKNASQMLRSSDLTPKELKIPSPAAPAASSSSSSSRNFLADLPQLEDDTVTEAKQTQRKRKRKGQASGYGGGDETDTDMEVETKAPAPRRTQSSRKRHRTSRGASTVAEPDLPFFEQQTVQTVNGIGVWKPTSASSLWDSIDTFFAFPDRHLLLFLKNGLATSPAASADSAAAPVQSNKRQKTGSVSSSASSSSSSSSSGASSDTAYDVPVLGLHYSMRTHQATAFRGPYIQSQQRQQGINMAITKNHTHVSGYKSAYVPSNAFVPTPSTPHGGRSPSPAASPMSSSVKRESGARTPTSVPASPLASPTWSAANSATGVSPPSPSARGKSTARTASGATTPRGGKGKGKTKGKTRGTKTKGTKGRAAKGPGRFAIGLVQSLGLGKGNNERDASSALKTEVRTVDKLVKASVLKTDQLKAISNHTYVQRLLAALVAQPTAAETAARANAMAAAAGGRNASAYAAHMASRMRAPQPLDIAETNILNGRITSSVRVSKGVPVPLQRPVVGGLTLPQRERSQRQQWYSVHPQKTLEDRAKLELELVGLLPQPPEPPLTPMDQSLSLPHVQPSATSSVVPPRPVGPATSSSSANAAVGAAVVAPTTPAYASSPAYGSTSVASSPRQTPSSSPRPSPVMTNASAPGTQTDTARLTSSHSQALTNLLQLSTREDDEISVALRELQVQLLSTWLANRTRRRQLYPIAHFMHIQGRKYRGLQRIERDMHECYKRVKKGRWPADHDSVEKTLDNYKKFCHECGSSRVVKVYALSHSKFGGIPRSQLPPKAEDQLKTEQVIARAAARMGFPAPSDRSAHRAAAYQAGATTRPHVATGVSSSAYYQQRARSAQRPTQQVVQPSAAQYRTRPPQSSSQAQRVWAQQQQQQQQRRAMAASALPLPARGGQVRPAGASRAQQFINQRTM